MMAAEAAALTGASPDLDAHLERDTFRQAQDYVVGVLGELSTAYAVEHRPEAETRWQAWSERIINPLKRATGELGGMHFGVTLNSDGITHALSTALDFDIDAQSQDGLGAARATLHESWEIGPRIENEKLLNPEDKAVRLAERVGIPVRYTRATVPRKGLRRSRTEDVPYILPYDIEQRAEQRVIDAIQRSRVVAVVFNIKGTGSHDYWRKLEEGIIPDPSSSPCELPGDHQLRVELLNPYTQVLADVNSRDPRKKLDLKVGIVGMSAAKIVKKSGSESGQAEIREKIEEEAAGQLVVVRKKIALSEHLLEAITASEDYKRKVA